MKTKNHQVDCVSNCSTCNSGKNDRSLSSVNRVALHLAEGDELLSKVLAVTCKPAIHRLTTKDGFGQEEVHVLWRDLLRFLLLAATAGEPVAPTRRLDAAWHAFILDTRSYREFCQAHLGRFVDHVPNDPDLPPGDGNLLERTRELAQARFGALSENWSTSLRRAHSPEGCVGLEDARHAFAPVAGACAADCEPATIRIANPIAG